MAALDPTMVTAWAPAWLAAWNALDGDAVAAMCTPDVIWADPSLPEPVHGREGVREFVQATARTFPDFRVEEMGEPLICTGEPIVLSRYRMTGTMLGPFPAQGFSPTGATVGLNGVDQWTFRDGALCHYTSHYDTLDMARQLGIVPRPATRAGRMLARLQHQQAAVLRRRNRP